MATFFCARDVFFSLLGFYIVNWNVQNRQFLSSHGSFSSDHNGMCVAAYSLTFLLPLSSWKDSRCHLVNSTPCKHKFLSSRVSYYPNSVSCFHCLRLVLSGYVQLNPGPNASSSSCITNNSKLSRSLCNKIVEFQGLVYGNNLLKRGSMMAVLMVKYYLLPCVQSFRKDRDGNKKDGGVLLAVKTNLLAYSYRRRELEPPLCLCCRPQNCSLFMDCFECLLANLRELNYW